MVDANVFLRWYVDQIGFEHAREIRDRFLAGEVRLETVDSVRIEFAHILHVKGVRKGRVDPEDYVTLVRLDDLGVTVHPTEVDAIERAANLAVTRNLRFFDAVIAERALRAGLPLLTSDKKLSNAVAGLVPTQILRGVP